MTRFMIVKIEVAIIYRYYYYYYCVNKFIFEFMTYCCYYFAIVITVFASTGD